ncbi:MULTISPECIES: DUF6973 domain-containing protein [unclassified Polaribacter]|uniref:DUF6973 domain-containing protein n=1 Tax=unclassified Polaribacter TaxID=196858 RepID=UPI0011BDB555|nr:MULTISPECIES: hypothetical protein [unclassified Polaribacter]TXD51819.1 hypothetical protein ES043_10490 [Polaribacter sp. IC063]TXD59181.1 hypothetical protein ES044_10565 [Polaribacter sp. IC066]
MKKTLILIFFTFSISLSAQSNFKNFLKSSCPIKTWVVLHPFKAKKALKISLEANKVSDSVAKTNLLDGDASGGQVDAFRHAYWLARLHQEIGRGAARSLGKAHEKDNYLTFKKKELEDGVVPDKISSTMDLYNNEEGLKLIKRRSETSQESLLYKIVNAIRAGKMKIIKKDKEGNFLTSEGTKISLASLKGKWKNNKCLVASDKNK